MQVSVAVSPVFWATMSGMTGRPSRHTRDNFTWEGRRPLQTTGNVAGGWWWRDSAGAR